MARLLFRDDPSDAVKVRAHGHHNGFDVIAGPFDFQHNAVFRFAVSNGFEELS